MCYILLLCAWGLSAQNVLFFGSKQGLSNSCIRNLYEDSRHNVWITTRNGLNRYDGVKMNVYRHEVGTEGTLPCDESTCVFELDRDKALVGTVRGLALYDYATDKFTDVPCLALNGDTLTPRIVSICKIQDKRVIVCYAGYGYGEVGTDDNGRMITKQITEFSTGDTQDIPIQLLEDTKKQLWIVNARRNLFRQTVKGFRQYSNVEGVVKLCISSSNRLYAATSSNGIYVYNSQKDVFERVASAEEVGGIVFGFNPWTLGRLFVSTDGGGLRIYDENTGQVTQSTIRVSDFNLSTSNVKDAIMDAYGNVWVGIYWKGVMMKPVNQSAFEYIGQQSISKNTIGTNAVFALAKAEDGHIWVAADNDGLYLISADGTSSKHWDRNTNPEMPQAFTVIANINLPPPLGKTTSTILLGTFSDGLWQMKDGYFSQLTKTINHIFEIRPAAEEGCYWIATMGDGFCYYDFMANRHIRYSPHWGEDSGTDIIGNPYVYSLLPVGNKLFVGTADGLTVCYIEPNGIITKPSTKTLNGWTLRHFVASSDGGTVWAATDHGLVAIDTQTLSTRTYTTADGLPINNIASLCLNDGKLWIGTDFGLSCMDVASGKFTNFFSDDGLQDNEFSRGAVLAMDGKLYFGGIGGLTYFDMVTMEKWQSERNPLHLRLVDLFMNGKAVHQGDMSGSYEVLQGVFDDCQRIEVSHNDNQFTIELCVDGLANHHVAYEYSINDGAWTNQGSGNRLVFANLETGTYHIKVRALAFGMTSEERDITAVVHPAWYASPWAKVVYFLLFLLACYMVYLYVKRLMRIRKVMARHRQQQELNEARVQFFMNISHEIRTPMTLILAPLERLIGMDKDAERQRNYQLIKQNSKRILRLINQMMDVRKIEQGKFLLDYRQVELVSFLQNIFDVFVTNAQSRQITYEFIHAVDTLSVYIDPDNTDKVVMNLLSNAFKFTPDGGKVTLELLSKEEAFDIKVTDSGIGIKEEDKPKVFERFYSAQHQNGYIGTGIGLNLTSMLVKLHKGNIVVTDNPEGQGAQFIVTMPIGDSSLQTMKPEQVVEESNADTAEHVDLLSIDKPVAAYRRNAVLVEDDEAIRQYVHSELSKDLVIQSCSNGQEAWDYIVSHPGKVDIVISDIMMPVMDGMTLCQRLKSNFTTNHIPVVLMTALGSDADRIAGLTNGADAYVSKPFNIDVLRTTVLQLMKTRQLLQGKFHGDKQQEEKIDKVEIESPDEHLMKRVMKVINENMDNSDLSVEIIADKVGISRVHFYRKMKDLTGQAPRDFVKYVRLKEAARLLSEKKLDITGVSIATGFKSLSAFSTNFKQLYGLSPTEWVKRQEQAE